MASINPPWPHWMDEASLHFYRWLADTKYGDRVDDIGNLRWGSTYRQDRANGVSDEESRARIARNIDEIRAGHETTKWPTGQFDVPYLPKYDEEAEWFCDRLRVKYQQDPSSPRDVDGNGWVRWTSDWRIHRAGGATKEVAWVRVDREINRIWRVVEPVPEHPGPLRGSLRYGVGGLWQDDDGPVLPMFCHEMSMFSDWVHGRQDDVRRRCQVVASAGYHGVRVLDVLGYWDANRGGAPDGWFGRAVTPIAMESFGSERFGFPRVRATPDYYGQKGQFLEAVGSFGLRVMDDRGDLNSWSHQSKFDHMRQNGRLYATMPGGRELLAGLWACNESWQNGVPDHAEAALMVKSFGDGAGWLPDTRGLSWGAKNNDWERPVDIDPVTGENRGGDPTGEIPDSMVWWSIDPATVITMHGSRTAAREHIIAHYLGYGYYDGDLRHRGKRCWNTEPVGGGVGVTVGRIDEPEMLVGIATEALLSGQAWTFMSGAGVWSERPIEGEPGFREVASLLRWLPRDLHTFGTIGHAGRRFQGTRILADTEPFSGTRADYAIHADGRFVMNVYGNGADLPFERACRECRVVDVVSGAVVSDGPRGVGERFSEPYESCRLVIGRLA